MNSEPASAGGGWHWRKLLCGHRGVDLVLAAVLLAAVLLPYAQSGLYGDDSINDVFRGQTHLSNYSLWQNLVAENGLWMSKGRFLPARAGGNLYLLVRGRVAPAS